MKPTENIANPASTLKTGLFAIVCGFLHVKGTSAPLRAALVTLVSLCALTAALPAAASAGTCPNEEFRTGVGAALPDCRAYELVTPPFKEGSVAGLKDAVPLGGIGLAGVSANGSHVDVVSLGDFGDAQNGVFYDNYQLTRMESGWSETNIDLPAAQFAEEEPIDTTPEMEATLYRARGVEQSLKAEDFWLREADGALHDIGPFEPPADTEGPTGPGGEGVVAYNPGGARFVAASSDLSHVLFSSPVAWPGDEAYGAAGGSLYEYIVGQGGPPVPVGVEPDGAPCAASYHGDGVSADGSTVIFACGGQIFARIDNGEAGARTVAISAPSKADCSACNTAEIEQIPVERTKLQQEKGKGEITEEKYNEEVERLEGLSANFVGDSADGSKVFFTTKNPLLGNDTSNNIYEYDLEPGAGEEHVVRVSAGDWGPGGAQAQGAEVSEDGSHVYFDATGALSGVSNSQGKVPIEDKTNIYVYERDAQFPSGRIAFIATEGGIGPMTPDGQFMVFTSSTDLTPGDTSKAGQVFEYDAQTGELVRCSIGQDGFNDNGNTDTLRAALPGEVGSGPIPQAVGPVAVSDNGAYVVFQSADGLTPAALNGVTTNRINSEGGEEPIAINNVYEYHAGNVYLISDGKDTSILDGSFSTVDVDGMSPSGDDIFFDTADSLVPQDVDTGPDLYDARIDGGFPAPVSLLPSCQGDACQGELSPSPVLLSPGSEFQAGGNPPLSESAPAAKPRPEVKAKRCRRGYVNKNGRCVRKLKAKKAKAKKASNNRRAGS